MNTTHPKLAVAAVVAALLLAFAVLGAQHAARSSTVLAAGGIGAAIVLTQGSDLVQPANSIPT